MIDELKVYKQMEIEVACDNYISRPITVGSQTFPSSAENLTLYKHAYDLGVLLGLKVGHLPTAQGVQSITSETLQSVILAMSKQIARGITKKAHYFTAIQLAKTKEAIDAITWEDVRSK